MRRFRSLLLPPILVGVSACGVVGTIVNSGATSTPPIRCDQPPAATVPDAAGTVQLADNGKTICLQPDQTLAVVLSNADSVTPFGGVASSAPDLLAPVTNSSLSLPMGMTAGYFRALGAGTSTLSATSADGRSWKVWIVVPQR